VQLLPEERIRLRGRTFRVHGVNASAMSELGSQTKELLETLIRNMRDPDARIFCDSMRSIEVDAVRVPAVSDLISRRAANFLAAIEQELELDAKASRRRKTQNRVRIGLTAFQTERGSAGPTGEEP
jgi:hypothetical protein